MSVVTVQVGQCGNQLGASLFDALHQHSSITTETLPPPPPTPPLISTKPGAGQPRPRSRDDHNRSDSYCDSTSKIALADSAAACRRSFFRENGNVARAVIVDTEPKVIQQLVADGGARVESGDPGAGGGGGHGGWGYDRRTQVCCHAQGGAANNWAFGYHGHGSRFSEAYLEGVRKEAERCDRLTGLCILHSAAGGTGSGLGTYLTEALRDYLPSAFLLNTVVCAPSSGEVVLQNYNTMFTLSKLARCSDGILIVENEGATRVCRKLLRLERPSHTDLNKVIAGSLACALMPSGGAGGGGGGGGGGDRLHIGEKLAHLCPNKDFVFLRTSMVPQMPDGSRAFTTNTWEALVRRAYQMHITGALADVGLDWQKKARFGGGVGVGLNQSVGSLLTFHGGGPAGTNGGRAAGIADCFRNRDLYADWSPSPFLECQSPLPLQGHDRALSLISNSQAVLGVLGTTAERSREMYAAGAYVHHFAKFGAEGEDFEEAFLGLEQAIENYRSLG